MMSCVFSCHTPPNHWLHMTRSTPGTDSICGNRRIGSDVVNDTRACVTSRVAPTNSAPAENSTLTACSRPNSRKAMTIDRSVNTVRVFLRPRFAITNPVRVMARSGRGGLFEQLSLLEVQRAARELGGLRVVRHHHDGLAVLAIQYLEQAEDLVGGLAVKVAGRLVADEERRDRIPARAQSRRVAPGRRIAPSACAGRDPPGRPPRELPRQIFAAALPKDS